MANLLIYWSIVSLVTRVLSIPTISISGTKFLIDNADKTQFFIKGVVYQPGGSATTKDPLADKAHCDFDVTYLKDLGANTVSIYTTNASLSHDSCMDAFAAAGIYVLVGLPNPQSSMNRAKPEWTLSMYEQYTAVIDVFAKYDNLLGFYMGNEIVNSADTAGAVPFMKAAIQDLKNYIVSRGHRRIPVGYNVADESRTRKEVVSYLACVSTNATVDFISFSKYAWCGDSSFQISGYDQFMQDMNAHRLPVFFGETGCNEVTPRTFSDQEVVLGIEMNGRLSGAIIYEWTQEANDYGLVSYAGGSAAPTVINMLPDYRNLKSRWATLNPDGTQTTWLSPLDARESVACPKSTTGSAAWTINPSASLPTLGVRVFSGRAAVSTPPNTSSTRTGLPTSSTTGEAAGTTGPSGSSTTSNSPTTEPNSPSAKKSSGTTIGIGVGVGIVALALLALLVWFLLRRRKQKKLVLNPLEPGGLEVSGVDTFPPKPELDSFSPGLAGIQSGKHKEGVIVELEGDEKQEVMLPVAELPHDNVSPVEAGAGTVIARKAVQNSQGTDSSPTMAVNSANTPWMDEGREEFLQPSPPQDLEGVQQERNSAAAALAQAQAHSSDRAEIERLEEEERRLDREIVESERLRNLQIERARVRSLLEEKRRAGGG